MNRSYTLRGASEQILTPSDVSDSMPTVDLN
eukprot:CAMPEP_0174914662 /NCGR_PEP_ID=MMETSP0167-20121228/80956_1 /TAXON_ID=38298 /ORGANISM="Rhodella maculata, Strain CCMP736" /LENGTH=30 /DNA_ID= /DNA_START= /DNA_END= /DNA_ORIENTATION=